MLKLLVFTLLEVLQSAPNKWLNTLSGKSCIVNKIKLKTFGFKNFSLIDCIIGIKKLFFN